MASVTASVPEVFTTREIARVAGVSTGEVRRLIATGAIAAIDGRFVDAREAVRAVRMLRGFDPVVSRGELFRPPVTAPQRSPGRALAASGALHALMLAALVLITTSGVASAPQEMPRDPSPVRLVFLMTPGPGGGGGGGGLRQPAPPKVELKGKSSLRSPVARPRPLTSRPPDAPPRSVPPPVTPIVVERPAEPPPPATPPPIPPVVAPVAAAPDDRRDRAGVMSEVAVQADNRGSGSGGGSGTGQGTGTGEGTGSGIGPGTGGGTGGGPYRPGSGITAPRLLREVKPDYTEEGRRRGVEGDVLLEIVVRADGNVGDVRVIKALGAGLDRRASDAVRQWRFSPGRRYGTPVDVVVEVAVEFRLR
jgi:TonB family protein